MTGTRLAEPTGFDAVAIGNIRDPGMRDACSMVDLPVLGLGDDRRPVGLLRQLSTDRIDL